MKSKILFIMHMPPPVHGAAMVGKYVHDSEIINSSFECHYLNLTLAKSLSDLGKGGIRKLKDFYNQLKQIRKEVKAVNPHLCYVTPNAKGVPFYKDFCVVMVLKMMKQKVIVHYHNKGVATRQNNGFDNLLYKIFFKNLKVILLAENLYSDVKKYVNHKDIYICPNGIPIHKSLPAVPKDKFNILFLSNMMKEKGVWDLMKACNLLKRKRYDFHCYFVGQWSDITQEEFEKKRIEYALQDYITACGAKYSTEKDFFFSQTDVFIFPTHNEAFGLVLLEAMRYNIPCIATNEGGIPSIIEENKTGFIIRKHSSEEIAGKIEYFMKHPEQLVAMGKAGNKKLLKEFTLEKFEIRMRDILEHCIIDSKSQKLSLS